MCLGELAVVRTIDADGALVVEDSSGRRRLVAAMALDHPADIGDWVLVHSGFALSVVSDEQALAALAIRTPDAP